jgi:hypothetical protein
MTDNRTEAIFQGTSCTNSVNLGLTTRCTMNCPHCSIGIPYLKETGQAKHATVEEIRRDAAFMQGLKRVHLTGGEPTMHPEFTFIATHVRSWFNCEYLTIETNGHYYRKYRDYFNMRSLFDKVFITHYEKDAIYPGSPDNTPIIELAQSDIGDRLIREPPVRHDRGHDLISLGAVTNPCTKWFDPGLPAGWYNGLLYKCCVTIGINKDWGIPVTKDWQEQIVKLPMGCEMCCYRGT